MKSIVIMVISFIVKICPIDGQILTIELGNTYFSQKAKSNIPTEILGQRVANDGNIFKLNYEQLINKKFIVLGSYSNYPIYTFFHFYRENAGGSVGWNGTNVTRLDISLSYNILPKSKLIIQPYIGLGFQISKPDGSEIIGNEIPDGIKPDNFELIGAIESVAYSNTQIVPVIGLKFGYAFWGRLELFLDIQQVFGHKIIQELRMSYSYKGIEQPQAISYSDGTGRFYALGIGYRFVKPKEK